jgi:hypothetical protein
MNLQLAIMLGLSGIVLFCCNSENAFNIENERQSTAPDSFEAIRAIMLDYARRDIKYSDLIKNTIIGDIVVNDNNVFIGQWNFDQKKLLLTHMQPMGKRWGVMYIAKIRMAAKNEFVLDNISEQDIELKNAPPE